MIHYLLSQYVTKKIIKLFGERGVREFWKKLEKLHDRKVIQPRLTIELTADHKRISISYLMFLNEKRYGSIKKRGGVYGSTRRLSMKNEYTTYPTLSI